MAAWDAYISAGGRTVHIASEGVPDGPSLFAEKLKGWWSTPQAKVSMTELSQGDGAHAISDADVLYSSRTVTLDVLARGRSRSEVQEAMESLLWMAHRIVTLRVADASSDTYARGYIEVESGSGKALGHREELSVTIVCPDPRRYGTDTLSATLVPGGNSDGGLDLTDARLAWPLAWGESAASHSVATLHNSGTAAAYPTISIRGDISDVTIAEPATGREMSISGYIGWNPIVLDCLSRTASISSVDVTRRLGRRDFPSIAPGGDTTLALMCSGTNGSVSIEWHDTYI